MGRSWGAPRPLDTLKRTALSIDASDVPGPDSRPVADLVRSLVAASNDQNSHELCYSACADHSPPV
jgi:hypothetical protein